MSGLYVLKPWYARRLTPVRSFLVGRGIAPSTITWSGVVAAVVAGYVVATAPPGVGAGAVVAGLMVVRLAAANLDGGVARDSGRTSRWGAVQNEVGDRLADLSVLAGCYAVQPRLTLLAMLVATMPSWVSLAGAAAGAPRVNGGPLGKTERCALYVVGAFTGAWAVVLSLTAAGSLITAASRLRNVHRLLVGGHR